MPYAQQSHGGAGRPAAPILHIGRRQPEPKPVPQNFRRAWCGTEVVLTMRIAAVSSWSHLPAEDHDPARQAAAQVHRPAPAGFFWLKPYETAMPVGPASVGGRLPVVPRSPSLETRLSS